MWHLDSVQMCSEPRLVFLVVDMATRWMLWLYEQRYPCSQTKGSTINDLGGGGKFRNEFIFSSQLPFQILDLCFRLDCAQV